MIKVDITLDIGSEKITIGYEEGHKLYSELSLLYSPAKTTIFDEAYSILGELDSDSLNQSEDTPVRSSRAAGDCSYSVFDDSFKNDGKMSNKNCTASVDASSAAFVDNKYIKDTDKCPKVVNDPAETTATIDEVNAEIADRVEQMKAALEAVNNKD